VLYFTLFEVFPKREKKTVHLNWNSDLGCTRCHELCSPLLLQCW